MTHGEKVLLADDETDCWVGVSGLVRFGTDMGSGHRHVWVRNTVTPAYVFIVLQFRDCYVRAKDSLPYCAAAAKPMVPDCWRTVPGARFHSPAKR